MKPGRSFNMSKSTKRMLATVALTKKPDFKAAMIAAEIASKMQVKIPRTKEPKDNGL